MKKALYIVVILIMTSACASKSKKVEAPKEEPAKVIDATVALKAKAEDSKPHWSYEGLFGPDLWGNLDPAYATCKAGKEQSPVDLLWKKPIDGGIIEFKYNPMPLAMVDTGNSIQFNADGSSVANIRGSVYSFSHAVLRSPSEHSISGKAAAAEIQIYHTSAIGEVAVLSVLINEGPENLELNKIINNVPQEKDKLFQTKETIDFNNFVPSAHTHYHYMGSLTTPPCTEQVNWNIFNTSISASKDQLNKLRVFYSNNTRPLQPLNSRQTTNY